MGILDKDEINLRDISLCPFDKEMCIKEKCMAWVNYARSDGKTFVGCTFVFMPVLLGENIVELVRNQASTDKVATAIDSGFNRFTNLALNARRRAIRG